MIQTIITRTNNSNTPEVKVFGVDHVEETERKRRRRRRRARKSGGNDNDGSGGVGGGTSSSSSHADDDHHSVDDGTCSTASLSSTSTAGRDGGGGRRRGECRSPSSSTASPSWNCPTMTPTSTRKKQQQKKNPRRCRARDGDDGIPVEEQCRYVALDCEMVGIGPHGGLTSSVAKVTLVAMDGTVLLDEFVRQDQEVTDYRTYVSGVTEQDLQDAAWTLEECRARVMELIDDKVLVGHALKNDLRALGVSHPWHLTRDTAKYEPFMQTRFEDGILWPRKLKDLVREVLNRDIQSPGVPHSAYEDAMAAMDLYRTVRRKWEKIMEYKIQRTMEIESKTRPQQ